MALLSCALHLLYAKAYECDLCREIQAHVPEDFWYIQVTHTGTDKRPCDFSWDRGRLFDHTAATILYELCVEQPLATVTKVSLPAATCVESTPI